MAYGGLHKSHIELGPSGLTIPKYLWMESSGAQGAHLEALSARLDTFSSGRSYVGPQSPTTTCEPWSKLN